MWTRGEGVEKSENFADVISGCSLEVERLRLVDLVVEALWRVAVGVADDHSGGQEDHHWDDHRCCSCKAVSGVGNYWKKSKLIWRVWKR